MDVKDDKPAPLVLPALQDAAAITTPLVMCPILQQRLMGVRPPGEVLFARRRFLQAHGGWSRQRDTIQMVFSVPTDVISSFGANLQGAQVRLERAWCSCDILDVGTAHPRPDVAADATFGTPSLPAIIPLGWFFDTGSMLSAVVDGVKHPDLTLGFWCIEHYGPRTCP